MVGRDDPFYLKFWVKLTVACSIVGSRLDYCNAMLYGAPAETLVGNYSIY